MNLSLFKQTLKDEAIKCYHGSIHSYENNPFGDKTNIINNIIEFEIEQSLGKNALKSIISPDLTKTQIEEIDKHINHYKKRTTDAFIKFTHSY